MVSLDLDYADFDDYLKRGVSRRMRSDLRRKFRDAAAAAPIQMSVVTDVTPFVDEIYPLYLQVYERSTLRFEKLTKEFLCSIGRVMPDKVRFFIWRQSGKPIAFSLSMIHGDAVYAEYLGLDYSVALKLHLYFYAFRDLMTWAIANGYKRYVSTGLNYEPKWHLRFQLYPLDLYVRHTSGILNMALSRILPLLEPTRYDKTLRRFSNYNELWHSAPGAKAKATTPSHPVA
jgi:predicted N-acyltransferase